MQTIEINSIQELRAIGPGLLEKYSKDAELVFLALANPILALEKLGYSFRPEFRREMEYEIRFGRHDAAQLLKLEKEVFIHTGFEFDIQSEKALRAALLRLADGSSAKPKKGGSPPKPAHTTAAAPPNIAAFDPSIFGKINLGWLPGILSEKDPLLLYADLHPAIPALISFRKMEASRPRFSEPDEWEKLAETRQKMPFSLQNMQFRLKNEAQQTTQKSQ